MKSLLIIAVLLIFKQNALAQEDCACCTNFHRQFDFWVGDWEVYDTLGSIIGTNSIDKLLLGCTLSEHWQGKSGVEGRSYSYYNTSDSTWNQLWIDDSGSNLVLKGRLESESMVLESDFFQGKDRRKYKNRVTWTPHHDGSVTQKWDILNSDEEVIKELFKGIYRRSLR